MIVNMVTHALRDGARAAAVVPVSDRTDGTINGATVNAILARVQSDIGSVMATATLDQPTVLQSTVDGIPVVTVRITGTIPYVFGFFGSGIALDRSVTFRDEGR